MELIQLMKQMQSGYHVEKTDIKQALIDIEIVKKNLKGRLLVENRQHAK